MKQEAEQNAEKLEKLKLEEKELVDMNLREPGNVFEKIHIGGVDEENAEDSNIQHWLTTIP